MVTFKSLVERRDKIAVVGLGYVGLPLAVHLSEHFDVIGYDLKTERIEELKSGLDRTLEVSTEQLGKTKIFFTSHPDDLSECRLVIVAVPTPIDEYRIPDLSPLRGAFVGNGEADGCLFFQLLVRKFFEFIHQPIDHILPDRQNLVQCREFTGIVNSL